MDLAIFVTKAVLLKSGTGGGMHDRLRNICNVGDSAKIGHQYPVVAWVIYLVFFFREAVMLKPCSGSSMCDRFYYFSDGSSSAKSGTDSSMVDRFDNFYNKNS